MDYEPIDNDAEQAEYEADCTRTVLEDIEGERIRQREKWGNAHDDTLIPLMWPGIAAKYVGELAAMTISGETVNANAFRKTFVKLAAVAAAAIEAIDRAEMRAAALQEDDTTFKSGYPDIPF